MLLEVFGNIRTFYATSNVFAAFFFSFCIIKLESSLEESLF